jgi:hypothetical protein
LLWPPFGSPDDPDTSQRGLLWQIAEARPNDLGRWVKEAELPQPKAVIAYVLDRWHEAREDAGIEDEDWSAFKVAERQTASSSWTRIGELTSQVVRAKDEAA